MIKTNNKNIFLEISMKEIISSIGKLNHIAIAVPSIQIASDMWEKGLGANISAPQILTDHGVKVIFVEAPNTKVELLEPLNKNSPISRFLEKNPNGKIIFLSTAGNMHQHKVKGIVDTELSKPNPLSLYGHTKLKVENILKELDCNSVVLRVSNVWGSKVDENRVNGLVDKLISLLDTDRVIEIYANLETMVDLIHVDDLISLILNVIDTDLDTNHELFLVGGQSISLYDIISTVSKMGSLNLKLNQKGKEKSFVNIQPTKAERIFNWKREHYL